MILERTTAVVVGAVAPGALEEAVVPVVEEDSGEAAGANRRCNPAGHTFR